MAYNMMGSPEVKNVQIGAAAGAGALALLLYTWRRNTPPKMVEEKYQGGEAYADPKQIVTGVLDDLKSMGSPKKIIENIRVLLELFVEKKKGLPVNDKDMLVCTNNRTRLR